METHLGRRTRLQRRGSRMRRNPTQFMKEKKSGFPVRLPPDLINPTYN